MGKRSFQARHDRAAIQGVPAVASLGNPRGFIPVDKNCRHSKHKNIFAIGVAIAIAPLEATPVPTGVPKAGFMTVKMAKTAAATISSDITGKTPPLADELGVICLMDMGNTAAFMKAYPVLPPRQSSYTKKAVWAKRLKVSFEKYYLFKMKHGISSWP